MSMTRAEIIEAYENTVFSSGLSAAAGNEDAAKDYELLKAGLDARRGPTREMVERMRGEWISTGAISCKCSKCNHLEPKYRVDEYNFCPYCMAAMTDEAVEMVMERWEAMKNDKE